MLDLVGNPGDRFSHNEAHIASSSEYSRHGSMASRDFQLAGMTKLNVTKKEEADIDEAFTKYSHSGSGLHSNGDNDNDMPSSPDSDSGGRN